MVESNSQSFLSEVIHLQTQAFIKSQRSPSYELKRGLFRDNFTLMNGVESFNLGYTDLLPEIDSMPLSDWINLKAKSRRIFLNKLSILDVGCGEGVFLHQIKRKHNSKVECHGLTAYVSQNLSRRILEKPGEVNIVQGDMHDLSSLFTTNYYDLVTGCYSIQYSVSPFTVLEGMHKVLKLGGVAVLNYFPLHTILETNKFNYFFDLLEDQMGIQFPTVVENEIKVDGGAVLQQRWATVRMTKKQPILNLPLRFSGNFIPASNGSGSYTSYEII